MDVAILYAGCGWMVPFEFGSGCWFEKHFDTASPFLTYGGVSAGSAVCVALALGLDMEACCEEAVKQLYVPCKNWPFPMCEGIKKVCQAGDEPPSCSPRQCHVSAGVRPFIVRAGDGDRLTGGRRL